YSVTQRRHGGGQQSGQSNDLNIRILVYSRDDLVDGNINAQVDYFEACGLDHHGNQVLSDIMKVAGNGSDDNFSKSSGGSAGKMGFQNLNANLHSFCGYQHLRNEDFVIFELLAYNA